MAARYRGYYLNVHTLMTNNVDCIHIHVTTPDGHGLAPTFSVEDAKLLIDKHISETQWTAGRLIKELQRFPAGTLILLDSGDGGDRIPMTNIDTNLVEGWVELQGTTD